MYQLSHLPADMCVHVITFCVCIDKVCTTNWGSTTLTHFSLHRLWQPSCHNNGHLYLCSITARPNPPGVQPILMFIPPRPSSVSMCQMLQLTKMVYQLSHTKLYDCTNFNRWFITGGRPYWRVVYTVGCLRFVGGLKMTPTIVTENFCLGGRLRPPSPDPARPKPT